MLVYINLYQFNVKKIYTKWVFFNNRPYKLKIPDSTDITKRNKSNKMQSKLFAAAILALYSNALNIEANGDDQYVLACKEEVNAIGKEMSSWCKDDFDIEQMKYFCEDIASAWLAYRLGKCERFEGPDDDKQPVCEDEVNCPSMQFV